MKKCTYCGKEYPDDALRCLIDEQPLSGTEMLAPILEGPAVGTPMTLPAPEVRRIALTERQLQIIEVVLVCFIAFGASILVSTYIFFGGAYNHTYNSFAWVVQALREGSCIALLWYLLRRRGRSFGELGFGWRWKDLGWSLILAFAGCLAFRGIYYLFYRSGLAAITPKGVNEDVGEFLFSGGIFLSTFLFQFINPFFEELIARAYVMMEVRHLTNSVTKAILISTALQTSYHFYQGTTAAVGHGATFLIFSIYYAKTNRIAPVILAHLYLDVGSTLMYWFRF